MEIIKKTSLEETPNVTDCLNWKVNQLSEDGKNIQIGLADYLYRGVNNIHNRLNEIKDLEEQIKERKSFLKAQEKSIKEDGAKFFLDNGFDRLDGEFASSVTVTKGKAGSTKKKFKLLVSKKESEDHLVDAGLAVYESVDVPATKDVLRINARKIALSEVVEHDDNTADK